MANIKNFGIKGVAADVQYGKSGGFVVYDSSNNKFQFKDNGSALEDVEFATVQAGTWGGTAIATTKGGTGLTSVAQDHIIYTSGANTFAASSISAFGRSIIDDADASAVRTTLGLGTISTQASDSVNIDGGAIDGTIIGANTKAAIGGTTITATTGFVGDVTGNSDTATALATARTITIAGDVDATATSFDGSQNITLTTTLDNTGVSAASYGSATAVPVITVDSKGRITAASTASISTALTIAADSGSNDAVTLGTDTLTFAGTANEIETAVTNNQIQIGLPNDVTIGNDLTVTGTLNSDDITSATVTITGDAVISGTLTVNGTTTTVNSTTVQVDDPIFEIGDPSISSDDNLDRGIKFNWHDGSAAKKGFFGYDDSASEFVFLADATENTNTFTGTASNLRTGDVNAQAITGASFTGASGATITAFLDEDNMASDSATSGATQQSVKAYVDTEIAGISSDFTLSADSGSNDTFTTGGTLNFAGTSNEIETTVSNDAITIGLVNAPTVSGTMTAGNFTTAGTITDGALSIASGSLTGGVAGTFSGAVTGGSLTDGTATLNSGSLTGAVNVTGSGTLQGGTLSDGTATITGGDFAGVDVTASGVVQFGSLSDGTIAVTAFVDEDNMASDSATLVPTQQSVKKYVDDQITLVNTGNTLAFTDDATTGSLAIDFDTETLTIAGGTGLTTAGSGNTLTVTLDNTAVTAASYGSSTAIPVLTVDAQGRITAASTASISTSFTLAGDSGSSTIDGGDTLTVTGGTNITSVVSGDAVTLNLDTSLTSMVAGTFSGAVQGGSITDGTATMTGGALSGVTTIGATDLTLAGNLTVNGTTTTVSSTNTTISDKLLELGTGSSGSASGDAGIVIERGSDDNAFFGWDESADQFQFATTTATGSSTGDLTLTDANLKAGTVTYASLSDGAITITAFVDEDNMSSDSATLVPTQQSVKAYVDASVVAQDDGIVRATATADSSTSVFTIGAIPSVSGRNYFANKAVIKVSTPWSGGSVDGFKITDDEGSETTFVTAAQADPTVAGTYVLDLGMEPLVSGTTLQLDVVQSNGSTVAVATAGAATVTVEYVYNT
jgi:hypothetical protein